MGGGCLFIVEPGSGSMVQYNVMIWTIRPFRKKLMSSFRFQARYGLFTYSQCGRLRPQSVSEHFSTLGADFIIGRETHSDGGTHLHVFADFKRKFRTRDSRKFDVEDFHPNVLPSRGNPAGGWDYATKDGDICGGELRRPEATARDDESRRNAGWDELRSAETRDEFFRIASEHLFSHLVKSFSSFSAYADWKFRVDRQPYKHPEEFTFNLGQLDSLREWIGELDAPRQPGEYRTLRGAASDGPTGRFPGGQHRPALRGSPGGAKSNGQSLMCVRC